MPATQTLSFQDGDPVDSVVRAESVEAPDSAPDRSWGALPVQRTPPHRPPDGTPGRLGSVLLAVPGGAVVDALTHDLRSVGTHRILHAVTLPAVRDLLGQPGGDLAVVSSRLGPDTDEVIRTLRAGGWRRVLVLIPTGAAEPALSGVAVGATGVLTTLGPEPDPPQPPEHDLSPREVQILTLVADGQSNKDIGRQLTLSALTVKNHLSRIRAQAGRDQPGTHGRHRLPQRHH